MNARLLAAFLCLASLSTGCIIVDHDDDGPCCNTPPPAQPGDVTFLWTFAPNGRCADVPEVKNIQITIPGETLHNGGIYACNTAGVDGIVLHDFAPGTYNYTIKAIGYSNEVLYQGSDSFTVNGDVRETIDLTPNGQSYAYVSWAFEANSSSTNPTCYQAGVTHVDVRIDNGEWARIGCDEGIGANQVTSPYLPPGLHTIELVGVRVAGGTETPYYYRRSTLTTEAGHPVSVSYNLLAVGGMSLAWELIDGSISKSCAQSGVTRVTIHLYDETRREYVYGNDGDPHGCGDAAIVYNFLRPGYYTVIIDATGPGGIVYTNRYDNPPSMEVRAFQQKTKDQYSVVYLHRQS